MCNFWNFGDTRGEINRITKIAAAAGARRDDCLMVKVSTNSNGGVANGGGAAPLLQTVPPHPKHSACGRNFGLQFLKLG